MAGNLPQTTQDRWQTAHIVFQGGITDNTDELTSAQQAPGSLTVGTNYEVGLRGGYRRINGYTQFDTTDPAGTGAVTGVTVFPDLGVVAAKNAHIYFSAGSGGWARIDDQHAVAITASISGNTLHVTAVGANPIFIGSFVINGAVPGNTIILSQTSGTPGGIGDYLISGSPLTVGSGPMSASFVARVSPVKVHFHNFDFEVEKIIGTDGTNAPFTWDGTTYTELTSAPLGGQLAYAFNRYMFIAKDNLLFFSAPDDETDWNGADGAGVFNVGFPITGITSWRESLYIFGQDKISVLTGTIFGGGTPDAKLDYVARNVGCVSADSIVEISGDVLYLSADGIRTLSGTTKIGDLEIAAITDSVHDKFVTFIRQYAFGNFCAASVRSKNQYRLFAANTGTNIVASQGWMTCLRGTSYSYTGSLDNWEHFQLQGINCSCIASGYINEVEFVVHGSFDGSVYRQEQGNNFNGANIFHQITLPYNGFDDPELRKTFYKLKSNIVSEGASALTVQLSFDYGNNTTNQPLPMSIVTTNATSAFYGTGVYGTSIYNATTNPDFFNYAIGSGLNMALTYSGDDNTSAPFTIRSVVMDYQVNGRR